MTPVFYIESGAVSGALVDFSPKEKIPSTPGIISRQFALKDSLRTDRLKVAVIAALKETASALVTKAKTEGKKISTGAIIILGAPWYVSQTKVITQTNRLPTLITEAFFNKLIGKAVADFEKEHTEAGTASLLEKKVTDAVLNGYQTNDPFGKKSTEARFSLFLSLTSTDLKKQVEEAVHSSFSRPVMAWYTAPLALFGGLRTFPETPGDFLILDVSAEVSELSLVRNNMLIETISFPLGTNAMIRNIAIALNATYEVTESLLTLTYEQKTDSVMLEKVGKALGVSGEEWLKLFASTLSLLASGLSLPATMYMVASKEWEDPIKGFIKKESYGSILLAEGNFTVNVIEAFSTSILFLRTFQKTKIS